MPTWQRGTGSWLQQWWRMSRHRCLLPVACGLLLSLALAASPAAANWLTHILKEAAEGAGGTARRGAIGLGDARALLRHISKLPTEARKSAVAATALPEGHWRLGNAAGETVTAATPEELAGALRWLVPEVADVPGNRLTFFVDEETVFRRPDAVAALPDRIDVRLAHGERTHAVLRQAETNTNAMSSRLYARIERGIVVPLDDARRFGEATWQLARGLDRGSIRILSLDAAGSRQLARIGPRDLASKLPVPEAVDPFGLGQALAALAGQTVLVTGKVEGPLLRFEAASGPARTVIVSDVLAAAERADVNLLLLEASSPLQPGVRNAFWQQAEVDRLGEALRGASLGDFLSALAGQGRIMLLTASEDRAGRIRLAIVPAPGDIGGLASDASSVLDPVSALMANLAAGFLGRIAADRIEVATRSQERQSELDQRLVPGIPSGIQFFYLGLLVIGSLGLPVALRWWRRVLPLRPRSAFAPNRIGRLIGFTLVFLPLAALPAAAVNAMEQLWRIARSIWYVLTAPLRWIWRRLRPAGSA